jgi:hypothetical protein
MKLIDIDNLMSVRPYYKEVLQKFFDSKVLKLMPVIDKIDDVIEGLGGKQYVIDLQRMKIVNNKVLYTRLMPHGMVTLGNKTHITYKNLDIIINDEDYDDIRYILYNIE